MASNTTKVDVGIVIALKEEFRELYKDLEQIFGIHGEAAIADSSGRYYYPFNHQAAKLEQPYRCVATFVGDMGNITSSLVTQRFIDTFQPDVIVILGIAGALNDEVKVGDVLIATQVDAYLENSKAVPASNEAGYTLRLSGETYRCYKPFINKIENFEFAHKDSFQSWCDACSKEFKEFLEADTNPLVLDFLNQGLIVEQVSLKSGHLASGPTVGGAEAFRDWLTSRNRKYQALEMESAGFMAAVDENPNFNRALVIRAISDYADERKKQFDTVKNGFFRRYAVNNALRLIWMLLENDFLNWEQPSQKKQVQNNNSKHQTSNTSEGLSETLAELSNLLESTNQVGTTIARETICDSIDPQQRLKGQIRREVLNNASDKEFCKHLVDHLNKTGHLDLLIKLCEYIETQAFLGGENLEKLLRIRSQLIKKKS
jgi:nucleoside phosphorylase